MINDSDLLISNGITKPICNLACTDIDWLSKSVALSSTILCIKAELDEVIIGLKESGIWTILKSCPGLFEPLFVYKDCQLSAGKVHHNCYYNVS